MGICHLCWISPTPSISTILFEWHRNSACTSIGFERFHVWTQYSDKIKVLWFDCTIEHYYIIFIFLLTTQHCSCVAWVWFGLVWIELFASALVRVCFFLFAIVQSVPFMLLFKCSNMVVFIFDKWMPTPRLFTNLQ